MAEKKQVIYTRVAHEQILAIMLFIAENGYPDTSLKFSDLLYVFGDSLCSFPEKYPVCYREPFKKRNLRCARFENYVFIYSVKKGMVKVLAIIHSSRIK